MKRRVKRGLSPVIATVLLVALVVVIGLIIFLWFRGFQGEAVTKFGGTNIQLVCEDVNFDASYSGGSLTLSNLGNVPIYQIQAKIYSDSGRTQENVDLNNVASNWPSNGLTQGTVVTLNVGSEFSGNDEALLVPVLRGNSDSGEKIYVCDDRHGFSVDI